MTNNTVNTVTLDRYSNGEWSKLLEQVREIRDEYARGSHSETAKHRFADDLRQLTGGLKAAERLIPLIRDEHRRGVEWALERLLVACKALETLPYVETTDRESVDSRVKGIILKIDAGDLDGAESEVRALERRVTELQMQSLDTEVATLLSGIGSFYSETVQ
jgi:hypothetical protein